MNITKVTYQKAFVIGPYLQEKVGFEAEIDDAEDEKKALSTLKQIVEEWHKENNLIIVEPTQLGPPNELPIINKADERLGILIENAENMKQLMEFQNDISTPYLADLFSTKLSQLQQQSRKNGYY